MTDCSSKRSGSWLSSALLVFVAVLFALMAVPAAAQDPPPSPPPPCPDVDKDGYVQCSATCTTPENKQCGDCDDGDAQIFLRAVCAVCNGPGCEASFCVPGSTNRPCPVADGDRNQNNGFCLSVSANTAFVCSNNAQRTCENSSDCDGGSCVPVVVPDPTRGLTCTPAGTGDACTPPPNVNEFETEGVLANNFPARRAAESCGDGGDNDCDGLIDVNDPQCQTPEICDSRDNDGDRIVDNGFELGQECFAGSGACRASGEHVCNDKGDGTVCNAVASAGSFEGPFGNAKCSDQIDNDCDGLIDFPADVSCTGTEICDGVDNDGDKIVDEGFDVGAECTSGVSSCQSNGQKICAANGTETVCNAVAKLGTVEGPGRAGTCSDKIDNDCDGAADAQDPSCGNVGVQATCALPLWDAPSRGGVGPGRDCDSTHIIVFDDQRDGVQVKGELLALTPEGTILGAIPVQSGELAHFISKSDVDKMFLKSENIGGAMTHHVFAPVPMLRVTSTDGLQKTTAYCTAIPYLEVVEPHGGVVTLNQSAGPDEPDITKVSTAVPRLNPSSVNVYVDDLEIFEALGKDGRECTRATPCGGTLTIHDRPVQVRDLVVDIADQLEDVSTNTVSLILENLGCGAHWVKVDGTKNPIALPDRVARQCVVHDLLDKEFSYTFAIEINSPQNGSAGNTVPTRVAGQVCHGLPIDEVQLNGREIFDPTQMTTQTTPDGVTTFRFPISESVGQTNVARDVKFGDHPAGTFDPGSNFVQAAASDAMGNRAFNNEVVFGTELTALPGVGTFANPQAAFAQTLDPEVKATLETELSARLHDAFRDVALGAQATIDVPNAFVVALDGDAMTNFFAAKCSRPGPDGKTITQRFQELADSKIKGRTFGPFSAPFPCSCDPSVTLKVNTVQFTSELQCPVLFPGDVDLDGAVVPDNTIRVQMQLPDVLVNVSGSDSCEDTFLGICIASGYAAISLNAEVKDIRLKFDITEAQLEGTAAPGPAAFNAGVSTNVEGSLNVVTDVGCIGGDICEVVLTILTFGTIDITPNISIDRAIEFAKEIGQAEPDPIALKEIKLDEEEIANFDQKVRGDLVDVNISTDGLRASLTGKFSTNHVDPEIVANPGTWLEMPPTPELPLPASLGGADDGALLVNADAINMMFASLTISGKLKSECNVSLDPNTGHPRTLGSLLPESCETLGGPNATAAALAQGFCHGLKEANCETLLGGNLLATPIEQGICHGLQGDDCSQIPAGFAGTAMPADCNTLVIGAGDSDDPGRATLIAQGRCFARQGADCDTLTAGDAADTAVKVGACHGQKGAVCTGLPGPQAARKIGTCAAVQGTCDELPLLQKLQCTPARVQVNVVDGLLRAAEQQGCNLTPSLGVNANQPLLFCARQDLPPRFLVRDELGTEPVEVGLRLNDLSLAIAVDRDGDAALDGQLTATPPCFGKNSVATGDCTLAALCLDLNFIASFELAESECPADGGVAKPGFKARILDVQQLSRLFGQVCGGLPAGDDAQVVNEATAGNVSIETLRLNAESFSPPACIQGLTLGGFVTFEDPTIFAVTTGAPRSVCENAVTTTCTSNADCGGGNCVPIQNFIGISTKIVP